MMVLVAMNVLAVECGSTPTNGCEFTVDTTINTGNYEISWTVNASNIVIDAQENVIFYGGDFVINGTNVTLDGFSFFREGGSGDIFLEGDYLTLNNMGFVDEGGNNINLSGDYMTITDSFITSSGCGTIKFNGNNILIDGNDIHSYCGEAGFVVMSNYGDFSGQVINNCFAGTIAVESYSGEINFTGNNFGGMDSEGVCSPTEQYSSFFVIQEAGIGDIYFYGNDFIGDDTAITDYTTDYPTNQVIYCVDGVGNTGDFGWNGDPADNPAQGLCPPINCLDSFETDCVLDESITLNTTNYNVESIFVSSSNIMIDCNGATINGTYEHGDFNPETGEANYFVQLAEGINNVTIKNCIFAEDSFWQIVKNYYQEHVYLDNINWVIYDTQWIEEWEEYAYPDLVTDSYPINNFYLTNSYIEGTQELRYDKTAWTTYYEGEFCPNNLGEYVIDSENCLDWDTDAINRAEEDCNPEMWAEGQCWDSRGTWEGGSCNECDVEVIDWAYTEGFSEWYACDMSDRPYSVYISNNIFNKSDITGLVGNYHMAIKMYGVKDVYIDDNEFYVDERLDDGNSAFPVFNTQGGDNVHITNNYVVGGNGLSLGSHNWDEPFCSANNFLIENNTVDISHKTNDFLANWIKVNNSIIRDNHFIGSDEPDKVNIFLGSDNTEIVNTQFYNNTVDGNSDYNLLLTYWDSPKQITIRDNDIYSMYISSGNEDDVEVFNNTFDRLYISDLNGVDICYGGVGNTYNSLFKLYPRSDITFDSSCPILNLPDGLDIVGNEADYSIDGNDITINGIGESGIYLTNTNNTIIKNFNLIGYDNSVIFSDDTNNNEFVNSTVEDPYYDYGTNNQFSNLDVPAPTLSEISPTSGDKVSILPQIFNYQISTVAEIDFCNFYIGENLENSQHSFGLNEKTRNVTISISDIDPYKNNEWHVVCYDIFGNSVNTGVLDLLLSVGQHETSDISGLVIDGGVELGVQYIRFVGLIALVGIGIWALNMLP